MALRDRLLKPASPAIPAIRATQRAVSPAKIATIATIAAHSHIRVTYPDGSGWAGATSPPITMEEASRLWPGARVEPDEPPSGKGWFGDHETDEVAQLLARLGCGADHPDFPDAIATAERHVATTLEGLRESVRRESEGVAP
jgi:hypothetical protein